MIKKLKIKEIGEIVSGSTPKTSISAYWNGENCWITPAEIKDDTYFVKDTERKITELAVKKTSLRKLPKGTVLLTTRAPIGKVAIADVEMYCNQGFKNIICNGKIDNRFLYYFLKSKKEYLNLLGRGATFKEISKGIVENVEITIYSIEEQKKIVKELDNIQELININKKQIGLLDELIKSKFDEMFGNKNFEERKIKEFAEVRTGGTPDRKNELYWKNGNIPWIKTGEVRANIINETEEYITELGLNNSNAVLFNEGTILIAMYGQGITRGRCAKLAIKATTNQACAGINIIGNIINNDYLFYYLQIKYEELRNLGLGGVQPNLNSKMIKDFLVIIPPIDLQNQFAEIVKQIEEQKLIYEKNIKVLHELMDKLMDKYFS